MRKLSRILLCLALIGPGTNAFAQSKAELKLYNKSIAKASIAAYDKFLKKYPSSVLAADITARKDTILSITPYTEAQASEILGSLIPAGTQCLGFPVRSNAIDRIYGVALPTDVLSHVAIYALEKKGSEWSVVNSYVTPTYELDGASSRAFVDGTKRFKIRGAEYYQFSYLVNTSDGARQSYVAASYCPSTEDYGEIAFSGSNKLRKTDSAAYRIYGRSNETMVSGMDRPQMRLMLQDIQQNPLLEAIPDSEYLTDAALEWWLEKNPDALTSATHLSFNVIQAGSSLIDDFAKAKGKQNSSKYRAAIIDTRGYTVIVVYQKASDDYVLAWVEPECKDHYRDRLLNSISFDDANNLTMSYYHGKKTFKYRLNLASKNLRR